MKLSQNTTCRVWGIGAALALAIVLVVSVLSLGNTSAAVGSLYLSPATKTVLNGDSFTVQVRANATSGSVAVVDLSYPSTSLDLLAYSKEGAFFTNEAAPPVASAGHFSMTMFTQGGAAELNGDALVLSLTFRAKTGSGTGAISIDGTSKIYSNGTNVIAVGNGTTVTFTSPPPAPPAAPVISTFVANPSSITVGGASTLSWATTNAVSCSVTPDGPSGTTASSWGTPAINSVGVINYTLTCKNASGVATSKATSVTIAAATAPKVSTATSPTAPTTTASTKTTASSAPAAASSASTPQVKAAEAYTPPVALTPALDPATGLVESNTLIIKDSSGKFLPNAEVIISTKDFTKTFITDSNGNVVISGVPAGEVSMVVKTNGKQVAKQKLTLVAGVQDSAKEIKLAKQSILASQPLLLPGVMGLTAMVAVVLCAIFFIKKHRRFKALSTVLVDAPVTVGNSFANSPFQSNGALSNQPIIIRPDVSPTTPQPEPGQPTQPQSQGSNNNQYPPTQQGS